MIDEDEFDALDLSCAGIIVRVRMMVLCGCLRVASGCGCGWWWCDGWMMIGACLGWMMIYLDDAERSTMEGGSGGSSWG